MYKKNQIIKLSKLVTVVITFVLISFIMGANKSVQMGSYNGELNNLAITGPYEPVSQRGNRLYINSTDDFSSSGVIDGADLGTARNKTLSDIQSMFAVGGGRHYEFEIVDEDFGFDENEYITEINLTQYNNRVYQLEINASGSFIIFEINSDDWNQENSGLEIYILLKEDEDLTRPAIDGQENFVTNVNEAKNVQYFISFLKAKDDIDGDISHKIQIETDNYTANTRVLGKHSVKVFVLDNAGNRSEFTFFVNVVDIDAPVISGNNSTVNIGYKELYDFDNFKKTLTVTDNYDTLTNTDITIQSNDYAANKNKLGIHNIVFQAKDKSDNIGTFTKPIKVIDNVAPVFAGTEEVVKSYAKIMTIDEILEGVTANDEIDGNLTEGIVVISDNFTGKGDRIGTYTITLEVKDNAGNKATRTITVKVVDDKGADWFIVNGVTINLTPEATLTRDQIIELLVKTGQVVAHKNAVVTYSMDEYSDNIGSPGVYKLGFSIKNPNGIENTYLYGINILSENTDDTGNLDIKGSFIKENMTLIIVASVALVGVGGFYFYKKKKGK